MPQLPRVTCLSLTMRGREQFVTLAVEVFLSQTYPNKELLFVIDDDNDSFDVPFGRFQGMTAESAFTISCVKYSGTVGGKRNMGCSWASGDLIAVWDDDDYSAPGRLAQQVEELQITGKAVTGYRGMKFTDGANWWQFQIARGFAIGSSLMFRRSWWQQHPFPDLQVGEDAQFANAASEAGQLAEVPDLNLMYATIHGGNTSRRDLTHPQYRPLPNFTWTE